MLQGFVSAILGLAIMMVLMICLLSAVLVLLVLAITVLGGIGRLLVPARKQRLPG